MSERDPWENTQRRYVAYCVAHGAVNPDEMIAADRERYPGGVMSGYIRWINERWLAWDKETGHKKPHHDETDHTKFDEWLAAKSLIGSPAPKEHNSRIFYYAGVTELSDKPAIYVDSPTGGDPLIVCTIARIHRPELFDQLLSLQKSPSPPPLPEG